MGLYFYFNHLDLDLEVLSSGANIYFSLDIFEFAEFL
jgi:hypothetical protein